MSLKSVGQLQRSIYTALEENYILKREITAIYLSIQQDAKYPFILINLLKLDDLSKHTRFSYEIEFEICLFGKERNQEKLLTIADHIIDLIKPSIIGLADYQIISLRFCKAEWIRGQDIGTLKIAIRYKALIMGSYV